MDKYKQRRIINDLLDQCGNCPKRGMIGTPDKICGGCDLYRKIRAASDPLWTEEAKHTKNGRPTFDMTEEEYYSMREEGFNDEEIAFEEDVSPSTVKNWKKRHNIRTARQKPKMQGVVINKSIYERLNAEGLNVTAIAKRLGVTYDQLKRFRHLNGFAGERRKPIHSDEEVLQALINKKSYWWIQNHLRCGRGRMDRLAREHGITR